MSSNELHELHVNDENTPPNKKQRKKRSSNLSAEVKTIIVDLYKKLEEKYPDKIIENRAIISDVVKVCDKTVRQILKEFETKGTVEPPKPHLGKTSLISQFSMSDLCEIRKIVHDILLNNEIPKKEDVMRIVQPGCTGSVFSNILKELGFRYRGSTWRNMIADTKKTVLCRRSYLRAIKYYRAKGSKIYYLDESSIDIAHLTLGTPSEDGPNRSLKQLIFCYIGSENGFVENALQIYGSTYEYHKDFDGIIAAASFEQWFARILNRVECNSVIILDNAKYHSRKVGNVPTSSWKREEIVEWLKNYNINFQEDFCKYELLEVIKQCKVNNPYVIDVKARSKSVTVLRVPAYHSGLIATEAISAEISKCADLLSGVYVLEAKVNLLKNAIISVDKDKWQESIANVIEEENKLWALDKIIDDCIDGFALENKQPDDEAESSSDEESQDD